jgi:hypothetical protein
MFCRRDAKRNAAEPLSDQPSGAGDVSAGQAGTICLLLLTIVGLLEAILAQMRGRLTLADRYRSASILFLAIAVIMAAYTGLKP